MNKDEQVDRATFDELMQLLKNMIDQRHLEYMEMIKQLGSNGIAFHERHMP